MSIFYSPWLWAFCAATPLLWKFFGIIFYRLAIHYTTVLGDLEQLGRPRTDGKFPGNAVVAGASIAGLFAARVLSDHFENVIMVEPDPELWEKRTRVPQWCQAHGFLPLGRLVLKRLFVDYDDEARRSGLLLGPADFNLQAEGKTLRTYHDRLELAIGATRMGFEKLLRRLVQERCKNVTLIRGSVTGLTASTDGSSLTSAIVRKVDASDEISIKLNFFVDCTGPASASSKLLARIRPEWRDIPKDSYAPNIVYTSGIYHLPPEVYAKFESVLPASIRDLISVRSVNGSQKSECPYGYGIQRGEDNSVTVACLRTGDGSLPESLHDVAAYFKKVDEITSEEGSYQPALDLVRILEEAFPETSTGSLIKKYKIPNMNHVRYDLAKGLPDNFAAHGDALINLNPIFGQGCTKAAMDATTLDAFLRASPTNRGTVPSGFSKRMMALQMLRNRSMFDSTRWMDYAHKTTVPMKGETLETGKFFRECFQAVIRLTHNDPEAGTLFFSTIAMVEPGLLIMKPSFIISVLRNTLMSR